MTAMAANYPSQTFTIPENQVPFYSNQQPSPVNSASPTSPRMSEYLQQVAPNPYKQLRPLKSPLYVPAVLRPTEHFTSTSPMTPPKSLHGSLDSLQEGGTKTGSDAQNQLNIDMLGSDWIQDEELGEVTGPPSRDHWKPDDASTSCDSPQCRSSFNLFVRKHHCRHCGHIFCSTHATHMIPLDQHAKFHSDGVPSRACETCHRQYQRWNTARSLRRMNSQASTEEDTASGPPTPLASSPGHHRMISGGIRGKQPEQAAASVPRDWHWSTF